MDMQLWRSARNTAVNANEELHAALRRLGIPDRELDRALWPTVTPKGEPYVKVGPLRAEHAELIAESLRIAAEARNQATASQETGS